MDIFRADKKDKKSTFQGVWKKLDGVNRLGVLPGANNQLECLRAAKNILIAIRKNGPNAGLVTFNHREYAFFVVWQYLVRRARVPPFF